MDSGPPCDAPAAVTAPPPAREFWLWTGVGLGLAVVMTWPLVLHLPTHVPQDLGDPLGQAWALAWGGDALLRRPTGLFAANTFWPTGPSLAYSDSLLGYAPLGLLGRGVTAAIVRYNVAFLLAYALAFAGGAMLARALGASRAGAVVAGAAFAFAPWRGSHNGHLNVLSTGGVGIALALLVAGYRHRRPWRIGAGWAVAAWQMTIGFALGIYFFYLLGALALVGLAIRLVRRRPLDRRVVAATVAGVVLFGVVVGALVRPYREVLRRYPEATRDRISVEFYSPPPGALLVAPAENRFWGPRSEAARRTLPWPPEQALFPGLAIVVLAGLGATHRRVPVGLRVALALTTVVSVLLSFGLRFAGGRWTYEPLYAWLPGFEGLRTPGRIAMVTSLALGVLGGLGTDRLRAVAAATPRGRHGPAAGGPALPPGSLVTLLATALVLAEGAVVLPLHRVPRRPAYTASAPQLHLPAGPFEDVRYMLWSVDGFPRIGNGYSGVTPTLLSQVHELAVAFPDAAVVQTLRELGFRSVVLHLDLVAGTRYADVADRPVTGPGIARIPQGRVVVYELDPG